MPQQSHLANFMRDLKGISVNGKLDRKFDALANNLMNNLCLVVGTKRYRIIELEVYYYDEGNHPDPYVHRDDKQLDTGNWYFNGMGIDITIGDREKKIYGGILIRGVRTLGNDPRYVSGPSNVLKEIFSNLGSIESGDRGICISDISEGEIEVKKKEPIKTTRIGLTKKTDDNNYIEKKYRYIAEVNFPHKFKDKEKVVKQLLAEGAIEPDDAYKIMGYKIKP